MCYNRNPPVIKIQQLPSTPKSLQQQLQEALETITSLQQQLQQQQQQSQQEIQQLQNRIQQLENQIQQQTPQQRPPPVKNKDIVPPQQSSPPVQNKDTAQTQQIESAPEAEEQDRAASNPNAGQQVPNHDLQRRGQRMRRRLKRLLRAGTH